MKWLRRAFNSFFGWFFNVEEWIEYRKNGVLIYEGSKEDMPENLRRQFDAEIAEADRMLNEAFPWGTRKRSR